MLPLDYHLTVKIRSPTRPVCTNMHACKVYVFLFYSGSFAEEVTKTITTINPLFFYRDIKYS